MHPHDRAALWGVARSASVLLRTLARDLHVNIDVADFSPDRLARSFGDICDSRCYVLGRPAGGGGGLLDPRFIVLDGDAIFGRVVLNFTTAQG